MLRFILIKFKLYNIKVVIMLKIYFVMAMMLGFSLSGCSSMNQQTKPKINGSYDQYIQIQNYKPDDEGKVQVAVVNEGFWSDSLKDKSRIIIVEPKADNVLSDMMVSGYRKYIESDTMGLSMTSKTLKDIMNVYGAKGLHIDAYESAADSVYVALKSLSKEKNAKGRLSATTITFYNAKNNEQKAEQLLKQLQYS
jgi:uncharacterized protein YceK